ncbi:SAM-dependent methyltransferase [Mycobacterium intermedium]|uniref:SAM-dependent methyltransferase n=1 Tax=Mycobacterium intermedium TaxID=28445 RepID=A0A1E3SF00_MYCIE|nr:class I SAM-dependent methyltransferase [Mycobacterium intermedium]MCV6963126.1 class I SAM-dependent methyltransferase [Mycobacterium intermedium]ODR00746.1 methyltransferase type 11 [Mycobacterium intermedium]OPE52358.1 SAM-dependent methyltransferase [Mycobacterium intermedium]ORB03684.1 SAM-dependent methyltransferase [Mycobacterium intermedium]
MPRGGPDASWLDRKFQTDALEYLDRDDVSDEVKQRVITMLDRMGTLTKQHEKNARAALKLVSDIPNPRILELGAGHGKLSANILALHPTATVTVSDVDPTSVAKIAGGPLGSHPRARTMLVDATAIDAEDGSYDLVVFALAFHHLPPLTACRAIAEGTRVGRRFLVIDLKRHSPAQFVLSALVQLPLLPLMLPWPTLRPGMHDGLISALRAYSPSALEALGKAADPGMRFELLSPPSRFGPPSIAAAFSRPGFAEQGRDETLSV